MENSSTPDVELYLLYKDVFPCWPLIGLALLANAINVLGMALNFGVIWVTVRNSSLRSNANFLLALYSLFEMANECGNLPFLWTALSRSHFVDRTSAFHACAFPLFGLYASTAALTFTGLDRLLAVFWPHSYAWMRQGPYLGAITAICLVYSGTLLAQGFVAMAQNPPLGFTTGALGDVFYVLPQLPMYLAFLLLLATILMYVLVGIRVHCKKKDSSTSAQTQRRLFRALCAIILFSLAGYLASICFNVTITVHQKSPLGIAFVSQLSGQLMYMSSASNAPILYWTSTDYRREFNKEWKSVHKFLNVRSLNAVQPSQQQVQPGTRVNNLLNGLPKVM